MTEIGIKFCGGCNPRYDRRSALDQIKTEIPNDYGTTFAKKDQCYDKLIFICGCDSACVETQGYHSQSSLHFVTSTQEVKILIEALNAKEE